MLPSDKDSGLLIFRFRKLILKAIDFPVAEFRVDWQAAANGGRFDGHEWPNIIVVTARVPFFSVHFLGGIGRKHKLGRPKFCQQHIGQSQSAVETATSQLSKAAAWFFAVPEADNCFHGLP